MSVQGNPLLPSSGTPATARQENRTGRRWDGQHNTTSAPYRGSLAGAANHRDLQFVSVAPGGVWATARAVSRNPSRTGVTSAVRQSRPVSMRVLVSRSAR